jgi:hypothetical protein
MAPGKTLKKKPRRRRVPTARDLAAAESYLARQPALPALEDCAPAARDFPLITTAAIVFTAEINRLARRIR